MKGVVFNKKGNKRLYSRLTWRRKKFMASIKNVFVNSQTLIFLCHGRHYEHNNFKDKYSLEFSIISTYPTITTYNTSHRFSMVKSKMFYILISLIIYFQQKSRCNNALFVACYKSFCVLDITVFQIMCREY